MAEEQQTNQQEEPKSPPGVLCPVQVYEEEPVELEESEKNALKQLFEKLKQRDMPARREEIIKVWEAHLFERGFQHLLLHRNFGWQFPQSGTGYGYGEANSKSMFATNIYASYEDIIVAALSREFPTTRAKPSNPKEDADITAAESAEKLIEEIIRKANGMKVEAADLARLLWTDGRSWQRTRYMRNAQKYGYEDANEPVVPENEEAEAEQSTQTGEPKGWQEITTHGALETKMPMKANNRDECEYLIFAHEVPVSKAKSRFPDKEKEIKPATGPVGGDDIDRLARVNVLLGVEDNFITADSVIYDVTEAEVWMRPSQLMELEENQGRDEIIRKFPKGCYMIFEGDLLCEARNISMDDEWELIFARPGDGAHRPGLGAKLLPLQKVLNNWMELGNDYLVRGVPMMWMDKEMFNTDALKNQTNTPGGIRPFLAPQTPGQQVLGQFVFREPNLPIPEQLLLMIQYVQNDLAQLLSGAVPTLFGGDTGTNDTAAGIKMQRDQALGRIGLTWRNIKNGLANTMMQSVSSLAKYHEDAIQTTGAESVTIEMQDITKGNYLIFPDTDENFPESWTERQNRLVMLAQDAAKNPLFMQILDDPNNAELVKDGIGLEELTIPVLESRDKQLGEIKILLKSGPSPNPAYQQAEEQMVPMQALAETEDAEAQAALQQAQQMLSQIPQFVSTVEVDPIVDDHATEAMTCKWFLNSPQGRKMKNGKPDEQAGYNNVRVHFMEHQAAQGQQQSAAVPAKPLSVSANVKDLPPQEAAEVLNRSGIPSSPQSFETGGIVQAEEKHPQLIAK